MTLIPSVASEKYAVHFGDTPGSNNETVDIVFTKYADSTAYYSVVFYKIVDNKKFSKKHFTFNQSEFATFLRTANSVYALSQLKEVSDERQEDSASNVSTVADTATEE